MGTLQNQGGFISPCLSLYFSLPPSILSLSAPTIPVSLDVLTERSGLWHMSLTPTSYGHFLFCLYIEVMHRQGVGLQVALPSSLPIVQEERRCWEMRRGRLWSPSPGGVFTTNPWKDM